MTRTSYNMTIASDSYQVTTTEYDEDGRPLDGHTEVFTNKDEAEAYMSKKSDGDLTPITNDTISEDELRQGSTTGTMDGTEKPASQMTEADAVALNSDVHLAGQPERIVTQGQIDQVEAGLHPDATEGRPLQKEDDSSDNTPAEPPEDLHVREPAKDK